MNPGIFPFPSGQDGQPPLAFCASFSGGTYSATLQKLSFTSEVYDPYGIYDAPNSRFLVPKAGVWYLTYHISNNSNVGKYPRLRKNGTTDIAGSFLYGILGAIGTSLVADLLCNDYVEMWSSGDNTYSTIGYGVFAGYYIG